MKVYVKKGECQNPIPGIILTIAFLCISLFIFYSCFSYNSFMEILLEKGTDLLFAIVFFAFSLYFLFILFKGPKKFNATLTNKVIENYNGKVITYMTFSTIKDKKQEKDFVPQTFTCYTYGDNDLVENENYVVKIKEFNWKIKTVEEFVVLNNDVSKVPNMTMSPVFLAVGFIFGRNRIF